VSDEAGERAAVDAAARLRWLAEGASPGDPDGWAVRHGIAPMLSAAGAPDPSGALAAARRRTEVLWQATAVHLERCLSALHAGGIRVLVLKGAALALAHYRDPSLRPMGDLDLLVPPEQWTAAARALERLDWTAEEPAEHGGAFWGPGGARLELHGALTTCPGVFPLAFDGLYARSLPLGGGFDGRRLGDEDTLLHLGLHCAFQHGFHARLGQYVDFDRVLAGPCDPDGVVTLAVRARALRALAASLSAAAAVLGPGPSSRFAQPLGRHVPDVMRRWITHADGRPWRLLDGFGLARARWLIADGAVCRARLLAGTLLPGKPDGSREVSPWKALARGRRLLQHLQAR
jgi:hypothetical protein